MASSSSRLSLHQAGILLLCLLVLAGGIYSFVLPAVGRFSDEREYLALSDHLRHGPGYSLDGIHLTASRPPGYGFFVAAIQSVGGGIASVRVIQYLLLAATILLLYRLAPDNQRGSGLLLLITGLVMIYPVLFYTCSTLYPQTLAGFLFVLALTLLVKAERSIALNLVTGLTFGLLILVVPTFALTLLVTLGLAWILRMIGWRDGFLIMVGVSIFIGLWTARNAVLFHQFVPLASNSGANFLIGNCENTIPYGGSGNVDRTKYREEAEAQGLDEFGQDKYYRKAALTWITENPGSATLLYFEKAANFFNVYNAYAPENKGEVSPWKQAVMGVSYGILLLLLIWRLVEIKRFPLTTREKLFLLIYFLSAFTCAIFFTRIRLRLPYDFLIIAVIASHLAQRLNLKLAGSRKS